MLQWNKLYLLNLLRFIFILILILILKLIFILILILILKLIFILILILIWLGYELFGRLHRLRELE